jgi:hypothetical protein
LVDAFKLFFPVIPEQFKYAWKTTEDWFAGKEVLQYTLLCPFSKVSMQLTRNSTHVRLLLIPKSEIPKWLDIVSKISTGSFIFNGLSPESLVKGVQFIDNVQMSLLRPLGKSAMFYLSFLLSNDYELLDTDSVFPVSIGNSLPLFGCPPILMSKYVKTKVVNSHPSPVDFHRHSVKTDELTVLQCSELVSRYEINVITQGGGNNEGGFASVLCD